MKVREELYPIAIIEDRYQGVYSKGKWVAIPSSDDQQGDFEGHRSSLEYLYEYGFGNPAEAKDFWYTHGDELWIAVGDTPNEALKNLVEKQKAPDSKTNVYETDDTDNLQKKV